MSYELKTIETAAEFSEAVGEIANGTRNELVLGKWAGGILNFAGVVFPGVDPNDIFVTHVVREPQGREPHFDAYKSHIDEQKFWLGHYNLSGDADVVTTELAQDLAEAYERRYPTQTDGASEARRLFSRIALTEPEARVGHGKIEAGTRMVLPIRPQGPHIVHDIVPVDQAYPGEFVKLIVPTRSKDERDTLLSSGYKPLDDFLTSAIGYEVPLPVPKAPTKKKEPKQNPETPLPPMPAVRPRRGGLRADRGRPYRRLLD